ncbi:MAG: MFS transporter [Paracoccus denitrificans]|nr:MAG: MFS transporter [Paracoccus denitrificans]PZO82921.1 MAG: MFS transporter [Paracoccus denitrificans]
MAGSRLDLIAPPSGGVLLIGPRATDDLSLFDPATTQVVQGFRPDVDALASRGFTVTQAAQGPATAAVVFLPRAKAAAHARVWDAAHALPAGASLWIDGQKTDGIDTMLKALQPLAQVDDVQSKSHGKIFRVTVPEGEWLPADWQGADQFATEGFVTRPGVFSADAVDPGSQMLADLMPKKLPTRVVDLGAGWGWLAAQVLTHPGVEVVHLVEADHAALDCAKRNVTDPRAQFHWADALNFHLKEPVNGVVMNPPFHDGRSADPQIGARFIRKAASLLTGAGRLWMVANRHLPYETVLAEHFADVSELGGDNRFKVITATGAGKGTAGRTGAKPARPRR